MVSGVPYEQFIAEEVFKPLGCEAFEPAPRGAPARKALGWPKRWKLAHAFIWEQLEKAEVGPTSGPTWRRSHLQRLLHHRTLGADRQHEAQQHAHDPAADEQHVVETCWQQLVGCVVAVQALEHQRYADEEEYVDLDRRL